MKSETSGVFSANANAGNTKAVTVLLLLISAILPFKRVEDAH